MPEIIQERKDMDPRYMWDLSTLYEDDDAWEKDLPNITAMAGKMASYRGTLKDAHSIRVFLDAGADFERRLSDFYCYASLRLSEDTRDAKAQDMSQRAAAVYAQAVQAVSFADPEILSLSEEKLAGIVDDPEIKPYKFLIQQLIDEKPHVLSEGEEGLMAAFTESFSAPQAVAESLQDADMKFDDVKDGNGEIHHLAQSNYILLEASDDRILRKNAFTGFYNGYIDHINTFAAAYNGAVKAAVSEASVRHYESSRAMSMAGEHIPVQVYDNLVGAVRKFMPAMYRYVSLRKKMLGVDELHYYDLYAPLSKGIQKSYTYDEAQNMILEAVAPLGEEYVKRVRDAFGSRWIDVYPNAGKRGGAFSSGTYDSNPFILTSFTGTLDSVSTIAHEMGHSQHTWLANHNQPPQYAEYTLFVAEVASTVNENLLVESLLKKTDDPKERMALLNQYLEGFKGTVYRQTMFAEFEQQAHELAGKGGALTASSLSDIYLRLIKDYFGPGLVIDDEVRYEWSRIPHFYRPFYVYKYATSYSAAVALSEAILNEGKPAAKRYLEFLSMGGSRYALDELKAAGVDFTTPEPVERALTKFEKILDEAEKTAAEIQE